MTTRHNTSQKKQRGFIKAGGAQQNDPRIMRARRKRPVRSKRR